MGNQEGNNQEAELVFTTKYWKRLTILIL